MQLKIAYLSLCLSVEIRPIEFYFKPCFVSPFYKIGYHSNASKFEMILDSIERALFPGKFKNLCEISCVFVSSS